jgi:hypothetical protein
MTCALVLALAGTAGCGVLLRLAESDSDEIIFADGVLSVTETSPLGEVLEACHRAYRALGYQEVTHTDPNRLQAKTPSGDPVDILLTAKDPQRTELKIQIGVIGNEAHSRLLLEQIRQSIVRPPEEA